MPIIDLNTNGAESFDNANKVLQSEAFYRLSDIIQAQITRLDTPLYSPPTGKELSYHRPHNGILIEGGRGSGKTTFLLNALHGLQGHLKDTTQLWFSGLPSKLQVLPPIDPTLIETKEHIIIVIIALIDGVLDDFANNPDADRTLVNEARREMAEGLGLLDGIGKSKPYGDEWEDPEWIMSRGLRKARNGRNFEIKFQKYIYESLKVLNKKAFVLAFDDVDTNFQHGQTILETIRKYLTSPQLILMISGDLELYGRLVRRNIYDTFGDNVMKYDPDVIGQDKTGISAAVQELEEQYLLKIVPPQNRISMLPLGGIMQADPTTEVTVIPLDRNVESSLQDWASSNIRRQLLEYMPANSERHPPHPFFELISREHLRLVIGYLRAIGQQDPLVSRRGVFAVFETRLRLAGIDSLKLTHANHNDSILLAFRWLVVQDKPTFFARFGVPSDPNKAIILHCFALAISKDLKGSPATCLRTLLTLNIPIAMMQRTGYSRLEVRREILEFIWNDASPDLLEAAGRIGSIARFDAYEERSNSIGNLRASCFGSVGTKREEKNRTDLLRRMFDVPVTNIADGIKTVRELQNIPQPKDNIFSAHKWINTLASDETIADMHPQRGVVWFSLDDLAIRCGSFGALLNLLTYDRFSSRGEQFRSVSAISMLAAIAKILGDEDNSDLNELALTSIIPAFVPATDAIKTSQGDLENLSMANDGEDVPDSLEGKEQADFPEFIERMKNWKRFAHHYTSKAETNQRKTADVSASELAHIAERMHDQLLSLDEEVTLNWKTGHILHRQITNVLHALIVTTSGSAGRLTSPKSSDRPLVEALRSSTETGANNFHPLAAIVLACPLVWAFLNPEESYSASGSKSDILRDEVSKALQTFQSRSGSVEAPFDPNWLNPPELSVAIGRTSIANPRTIKQSGFFDLLNVVPRYYSKSGSSK